MWTKYLPVRVAIRIKSHNLNVYPHGACHTTGTRYIIYLPHIFALALELIDQPQVCRWWLGTRENRLQILAFNPCAPPISHPCPYPRKACGGEQVQGQAGCSLLCLLEQIPLEFI
jgi:hypothetical protein